MVKRESASDHAAVLVFALRPDGTVRGDIPESERQVFRDAYLAGHSVRWIARNRGMRRDTVREYLRRLQARAAIATAPTKEER